MKKSRSEKGDLKTALRVLDGLNHRVRRLIKDESQINEIIDEVMSKNSKIVADYQAGKVKALQSLIGQVMRVTSGKAEPIMTKELLLKKLLK